MANRQARLVPTEEFKGRGEVSAQMPGVPAASGAEAYAGAEKSLAHLSSFLNAWADQARTREGKEEGAAAGEGDNLALRRDGTLYGEAYDKAATDAYAGRLTIALRNDMFDVAHANKDDPQAMAAAFEKLKTEYKSKAVVQEPEIQAHFDKTFADLRFPYEKNAVRVRDTKLRAEAADATTSAIDIALRDASRSAYTLGGDPEGDKTLAAESVRIKKMVANAQDSGYYTPAAATRRLAEVDSTIEIGKIAGQFARLDGVDAKVSFARQLDDDYQAGKVLKTIDARDYQRLQTDLRREIAAADSQARQGQRELTVGMDGIRRRAMEGVPVGDDEWAGLDRIAQRSGADAQGAVTAARLAAADIQQWWSMAPADLEAAIAKERARLGAGTGADEFERVKRAQTVLSNMRKEIGDDPLSFGERTGRIAPTALSPDVLANPELIGPAFARRKAAAEQVAESVGAAPKYFTRLERAEWSKVLNAGGSNAAAVAVALTQHLGPQAGARALGELSDSAGVMAQAASVFVAGGSQRYLTDVAEGRRMATLDGYKPLSLTPAIIEPIINKTYGEAFSRSPPDQQSAVAAAVTAFDYRARTQGFGTNLAARSKGRDIFERSLQEAAGATFEGDVQFGGVATVNGRKTALPSNVRASHAETLLATVRDADLAANPPVGSNGKPLLASDLRSAKFVAVGDGRYRVARGDPDGERPQWFADATGNPWVLDLKALEPALKERRPDLYRGGPAPSRFLW